MIEPQEGCIYKTLRVIGDKWTPLILRELADGTNRFGAMQKNLHCISPRTLSQRLDHLEAEGILTKQCYAVVPPRIEYTLTEKGRDLIPILKQMAEWGLKH